MDIGELLRNGCISVRSDGVAVNIDSRSGEIPILTPVSFIKTIHADYLYKVNTKPITIGLKVTQSRAKELQFEAWSNLINQFDLSLEDLDIITFE